MNTNLNIPSPRRQLGLFFLLLLGGLMLFFIISAVALVVVQGTGNSVRASSGFLSTDMLKFLQAISTITIFLIPAWLFAVYVFREKPFRQLGFHPATKNIFYILAVFLLLLSFPLDGWLGQLNKGIPLPNWMIQRENDADRQIADFLKTGSLAGLLINIFVIALLPAICEEACFRGALQPILIRICKSPWGGILLTAIIFSAFHFQFQGFLPRLVLGLLLGAVYWYSGSLWVSIAAHFFTNAVQVIAVARYPDFAATDPTVPIYAALISLAMVTGLLIIMRRKSTADFSRDYPKDYDEEFQ